MTIEEFCERSPYLYHLTSVENLKSILNSGEIYSTNEILNRSSLTDEEALMILREKRDDHVYVDVNGVEFMIRDQKPISIKALTKTLTHGWTSQQFLETLNDRVFFWPSISRLNIHFAKYQHEKPKIIRVDSREMIELNEARLKFCHLNSGATRCHPKWKAPPPRGADTFVPVESFLHPARNVAEVTFDTFCVLPEQTWISNSPEGPWRKNS